MSTDQFQTKLLDAVGQAVVATDRHGTILSWNGAAELLFGWPAEHAVGRQGEDLVMARPTPEDAAENSRSLREGRSWSGYFEMERHHRVPLTLFVTTTPVFDDEGRLESVICVASDVTERKVAEDHMRALSAIVESSADDDHPVVDRRPDRVVERRRRSGLRLPRLHDHRPARLRAHPRGSARRVRAHRARGHAGHVDRQPRHRSPATGW